MSRLVKKAPSQCTDLPLDNTDISEKLRLFLQLLRSCVGPTGRLKQIRNNIGGHVVTTSTSSVLLPAISSSQPLVNLIKSSICNHVSRFSDCGLFAVVLCLTLIERAKQSGLRRHVVIDINKHLLALCAGYLQQEDCGCKVKLDFSSSQNLITLARSVISSKPACVLTEPEVLHISRLCVQAFVQTVPCSSPGTVRLGDIVTVSVEGLPVLNSAVFSGLMVEMPDVFSPSQVESTRLNPLRTVLFSASLAGDLSEVGDGNVEVAAGVDTDLQILDQLLDVGRQVVRDEAKLFVCQKVIHPVLQQYLRSHGVLVVERVGIALMEPLSQLTGRSPSLTPALHNVLKHSQNIIFSSPPTGAHPVAALHTAIPAKAYGKVREVSVRQFGSKRMLHLLPVAESVICTRILCHRNETMLSELKVRRREMLGVGAGLMREEEKKSC